MVLAMSRPQLHPRSGVYWLRKRVPADLVALIGRREVTLSLQTKDPAEARARYARELARLEQRWAGLRAGSRSPTEVEAHALAVAVHEAWLERHRANPSEQALWQVDLAARLWAPPPPMSAQATLDDLRNPTIDWDLRRIREMEAWCEGQAASLVEQHGLNVDETGRRRLNRAVAAAVQRASLTLERFTRGEFAGAPANPAPAALSAVPPTPPRKAVSFDELLKGWEAETKPRAKTVYEWTREITKFAAFLGHTDTARITADDVVRWKEALIAEGLSAKTIGDGKLAAVRTVLQWGVDSRRLTANPAAAVRMATKRTGKERRSFTDAEAATILAAALRETNPVLRWVPWLCAYSGARLSEVCQLRVTDVREIEGIWCMVIDGEAGSVKTASSERIVPLHPAVLDGGFLAFVRGVGAGPLFAGLPPDKFGRRGGNGTKVLGRWVRGLGLDERRLAPAHSWRHRMSSLARRYKLAEDVTRALMGHSKRDVAEGYGEFEPAVLHHEVMKIPALALPATD
ncbi:integrase [Methylobacterium sp. Leaf90]|nr:integrase [Methylobacterium sp. Leaf90]